MTQTPIETPPVKLDAVATRPAIIGLHIGEPFYNVCYARLFPLDNPFGTMLLSRVLTLALSQDLLLEDGEIIVFGTLADGVGIASTRDARLAIEAIKAELAALQLLPMCQIGIKTPDGWQCVFPGHQVALAPLMDLKRVRTAYDNYQETINQNIAELLKVWAAHCNPPPGDCPPAPAK